MKHSIVETGFVFRRSRFGSLSSHNFLVITKNHVLVFLKMQPYFTFQLAYYILLSHLVIYVLKTQDNSIRTTKRYIIIQGGW